MTSPPPPYRGPRFKLELGKFPVLRVVDRGFGEKQFALRVNEVSIVITAPHDADVHEGDLLTLYTEVAVAVPKRDMETQ